MFKGSIVALITPMDADGAVDFDCVPALLAHLLDGGSDGIVVAGTTGESASLEAGEYEHLLKLVLDEVRGRVPVLAGTGAASTSATIHQTQVAQSLGADAALIVTPYYYRPTPSGLEAHYLAVADAVELPIVLYNVPSRTAVDLPVDVVSRLAERDSIVAIKEASPGVTRVQELLDACGDRLNVLSGDDGTCTEAMLAGASGVISVAANVAPRYFSDLCELATKGDRDGARALEKTLQPLIHVLGIESNPIPVKWAAHELNLVGAGIRLPLQPLNERYRAGLRACLQQLGLLAPREP